MSKKVSQKLLKEVDAWNKKVQIGDEVEYRSHPHAEAQVFKTRTAAEVLSGHTAVVWLEGKSGCVCCDACTPIAKPKKPANPTGATHETGSHAWLHM